MPNAGDKRKAAGEGVAGKHWDIHTRTWISNLHLGWKLKSEYDWELKFDAAGQRVYQTSSETF